MRIIHYVCDKMINKLPDYARVKLSDDCIMRSNKIFFLVLLSRPEDDLITDFSISVFLLSIALTFSFFDMYDLIDSL